MESIPARAVADIRFDETVDVVVVGLGVAGSSAVVTARQSDVDVLAVERAVAPGGTSANSGGLIYLGGGTALQRACGFDDSTENMRAFLGAALGPNADEARLDAYCEGSTDHFDWLTSVGVPFRAAFCDEPNRESADDAGLLFSGGEDSYPFDEIAVPVPRGHKPQYTDAAGGFLMERLGAAVASSAARVVADARAEALVVDGDEAVGVLIQSDEGPRAVHARGGVVLAAGGFIHNEAMVAELCPVAHVPDSAWRIGTPNDDGRGIRMGVGIGAATTRLGSFECALPLGPPHRLARGILVNRHGERFINEDTYTGRIGLHALRDQHGFVYMLTDDVIHEPNLLGLRIAFAAATPEELAVDLGLPPEALARTVRDYNDAAARGEDPAFHKRAPYLQPIGVPPASGIGAIDLRVDHGAIYATFTLGGLVTDADGAALDGTGAPIAGLYAAGRTAASLAASHYASGISLGDGSFFGRRAGRHAAGARGAHGARLVAVSAQDPRAPSSSDQGWIQVHRDFCRKTTQGAQAPARRGSVASGGWTMEDRRRAQRLPAVWMGSCHVEGDSSDQWRECGVFDFSTLGVGMDFRHPGSSDLVGRRISVRLPVGDSVDMTFTGHVRNAKPGPDRIVRAGVEFFGLSEDELYVIDLLELGAMSTSKV